MPVERQPAIIERLKRFDNWQDRYREIIAMGKNLPAFPEEHRIDKNKVKGCQSQVWLHAETDGERVTYYGDSDALIVRGFVAIVLEIYSGSTFDEIIATLPHFIEELGFAQHFSVSRTNGLASLLKQVKLYAVAFKSMNKG